MDKQVFLDALKQHKGVHITHTKDGAEEPTERDILPFYLTKASYGSEYVHGYCALRHKRRSFRLDRIDTAELRSTVVGEDVYTKYAQAHNLDIEPLGLVASYNRDLGDCLPQIEAAYAALQEDSSEKAQ